MDFDYKIIQSNRKTIALVISDKGELIIRVPKRTSERIIKEVMEERKDWITEKLYKMKQSIRRFPRLQLETSESILFMGEGYEIVLNDSKRVVLKDEKILIPDIPQRREYLIRFYKKMAKQILTEKTEYYANIMDIQYNQTKITSAKGRWGSCNSEGTICYSWYLLMCPNKVIDYVIVHELCHRLHMDHSITFWECVERVLPDYKIRRKWLRDNQSIMGML